MGEYNKGILGPFSGKVGPVVGANWRGKDVMRSRPKKSRKAPSERQSLQRQKFAYVTHFVRPLAPMLGRYFGHKMGDRSKKNMALSYHLLEAVAYDGIHYNMLFEKVQISRGDLVGPLSPNITAEAGGTIRFSWSDNSGQSTAKANDQLVAVIHDPEKDISQLFFNIAQRSDTEGIIELPDYLTGAKVQCWIAFVSADEKQYATSSYMGQVTVV